MSLEVRALIRASWQESLNREWRFSPAKAFVWRLLLQLGLAGLVLWRLSGQPAVLATGPAILLGALQAAIFAFMTLLLRGRNRLYSGSLVQLIHLSPTPAQAVILAEVLGQLPGRAWSATLFTAALLPALPPEVRLAAGPALWLAILAGGLLGHLAALVALIAWVRALPQALGGLWLFAMVSTMALAYSIAYLLIAGVSVAEAAAVLQRAGRWLPVVLGLGFGLPGLVMALRLALSPWAAGEAYRESWLAVMALGDASSRPRRSRFPRIAGGPAGALQALVWLMALRNSFSVIRLGLWAACLAALTLAGPALGRLPDGRQSLFILGLGLGTALLNYGEQAAALFAADGPRVALLAVTGMKPAHLLWGKWLAASPMALVAGVSSLVAALAAGVSPGQGLLLGGASLLIGLLSLSWLTGFAAFDALPREQELGDGSAELSAALEQVPTRLGGQVGLTGGVALAAAATWLWLLHPGWTLALLPLPLIALAAGHRRLHGVMLR